MRRGTYSIVARDPETGELGVAVQSHWFSVGSVVSAARAEVGAVASQSIVEPAYRERLLDRLEAGEGPAEALRALLAEDEAARFRQVAVIDAAGETAVHTGDGCIPHAGHRRGPDYSAQANMMASPEVWPAMAEAFEQSAQEPLALRLLAALDAAEAAGGDVRGRQSAALVVVPQRGRPFWRTADLRVEDHPEPLAELRRLATLHEAYALASEADELVGEGRHDEAAAGYRRAAELAPDNDELIFWSGLALAGDGDVAAGAAQVRRAIEVHAGWRDLLARLDSEVAPAAEAVCRELGISR
jgi:uncharacterized Ntn-hydrolase superfamily protein